MKSEGEGGGRGGGEENFFPFSSRSSTPPWPSLGSNLYVCYPKVKYRKKLSAHPQKRLQWTLDNSLIQPLSKYVCVLSDSWTDQPYLKKSKETNKNVKEICDPHCCVQNDPLVCPGLISQLAVHGQDVKMTRESESSNSYSCEETSKVFGPPLDGVCRAVHCTSDVTFNWFENHNSREENYTNDTETKKCIASAVNNYKVSCTVLTGKRNRER